MKNKKIAVGSIGKDEESEVSQVGARAPYFLIFENSKLIETIKNPFAVGGGGAGFGVAKMLADKGVNMIIAGRFGPNMEFALKQKNIEYKSETGKKVKQIVEENK